LKGREHENHFQHYFSTLSVKLCRLRPLICRNGTRNCWGTQVLFQLMQWFQNILKFDRYGSKFTGQPLTNLHLLHTPYS